MIFSLRLLVVQKTGEIAYASQLFLDHLTSTVRQKVIYISLIKPQSCHHIETSQLICREKQLTGFYIMATLAFNELNKPATESGY